MLTLQIKRSQKHGVGHRPVCIETREMDNNMNYCNVASRSRLLVLFLCCLTDLQLNQNSLVCIISRILMIAELRDRHPSLPLTPRPSK